MDNDNDHADAVTGVEHETVTEAPESGYDIPATDEQGQEIAPSPDEHIHCIAAFIVYITEDGKAIGSSASAEQGEGVEKLHALLDKLAVRREATLDDMRRAAHEMLDDVAVMLTAQQTINNQMALAQQMARQAQQDAVLRQIADGGKLIDPTRGRGN